MNTLILELPDEYMQKLESFAQQQGVNISTAVKELINYIPVYKPDTCFDITKDSVYNIKSHETDAPADLSQNIDYYLYGAEKE